MKGVNKIFITFGLLVVFLFGSVWQMLQTEMFAKIISDHIQAKFLDGHDWKVSFSKLEVDMFPPATILKGVSFRHNKKVSIELEADSFGLYFSFWNLFSKDLSIEEIRVMGGVLEGKNVLKKSKQQGSSKKRVFEEIHNVYKKEIFKAIPFNIKKMRLFDVRVFSSRADLDIDMLALNLNRTSFSIKASLHNVNSRWIKKYTNKSSVDELSFEATLNSAGVQIKALQIRDDLLKIDASGKVVKGIDYPVIDIRAKVEGEFSDIFKRAKLKGLSEEFSGLVKMDSVLKGSMFDPEGMFSARVNSFSSSYAKVETGSISGGKRGAELYIDKMNLFSGKGEARLVSPVRLYDLKKRILLDRQVRVRASNLHTNHALHIINDVLHPLKGYINGEVDISWHDEIKITILENASLRSFQLIIDDPTPILKNDEIVFNDGVIVVHHDGLVSIKANLKFENSDLAISGRVDGKGVSFAGASKYIDLVELGPISGTQLYGAGSATMVIDGPFEDVKFRFNLNHKNVEVFGLKLGNVNTDLEFSLETLDLKIKGLNGLYGGTSYFGKGTIGFDGNFPIDLWVNVPRGSYKDSQDIYKSLLELLDDYPKTLSFTYGGSYTVKGNVQNHDYDVRGYVQARNVWWLGEEMDRVSGRFHYKNDIIKFNDVKMIKKDGRINGDVSYNYKTEAIKYSAFFQGIRCRDIYYYRALNFGLDGEMHGSLKGEGSRENFSSSSVIKIIKSRVGNTPVKNSLITVYNDSTDLFINGNFIGDLITFDSFLNLKKDLHAKSSYLNMSVQGSDIRTIAGIVSSHNKTDASLSGRFYGSLSARFTLNDIKDLDLDVRIDDFRMKKGAVRLILEEGKNSIVIKKGAINKWDIGLRGRDLFVKSTGEGVFNKKVKINNDFVLDSQLMTLFSPFLVSAKGKNAGHLVYIYNDNKFNLHMKAEGRGISFKVKDLPSQFEKINYRLVLEDDELIVDHLEGRYGGGEISVDGNVVMAIPFPVLDLGVSVKRSEVQFFEKSSTTVTAQGSIKGSAFPYIIAGHVFLNNTEVYDGINQLYKMSGAKGVVSKYLPTHALRNRIIYYNYDLDVTLDESAHIRNSMLDFFMNGACHVGGTLNDVKMKGRFVVEPKMSKINFTGHDFIIDDGWLQLSEKSAPQYSFTATSSVNEYNVKLETQGRLDNIEVKLTSEPSLPQQDIVSLLTIGVTSDISQNLENQDRQSITSIGIGALLVDQLKINEGLNESLGLQLSVMPEFEQDEDVSMLSGRTEGSNVTAGSMKSATKIKLQKKILGVDFSVSSTVGGSMNQKQEMKVKWDLLENMSLEGVYEIKSSDDEENDASESLGADVKLRWSF